MEKIKSPAPFILIGWRNMWRQKRRSLVVITSIAIGISALILLTGFINGMMVQMVDNTINTALGHVAIHRKGFRTNIKLEYRFIPERRIIAAIGRAHAITPDMVKDGAVLIDVGINRIDDASRPKGYRIVGDIDFDGCRRARPHCARRRCGSSRSPAAADSSAGPPAGGSRPAPPAPARAARVAR